VWPPTRPGCRQVRGDPGSGGVVEIGVVASGAHGFRNRPDESKLDASEPDARGIETTLINGCQVISATATLLDDQDLNL
jgi:hypothetical protein